MIRAQYNVSMSQTAAIESPVPIQSGVGLAAMILGALCLPTAACLGVACLTVALPVFGLWFFVPVIAFAIVLGMIASRTAQGVAGAILSIAALILCMMFVLVDRSYGPDIRQQLNHSAAPSSSMMKLDQLFKMSGDLPKLNASPTTQPK
jgi:hypothetical protein